MITAPKHSRWVADLMDQQNLSVDELARSAGVDKRIVEAIAEQRYTPAPEHRDRVSQALGVDRQQIVWGHFCGVEQHIHSPD